MIEYIGSFYEVELQLGSDCQTFSDTIVYGYHYSSSNIYYLAARMPNGKYWVYMDRDRELNNDDDCVHFVHNIMSMYNDAQPSAIEGYVIKDIVAQTQYSQANESYNNGDADNLDICHLFVGIKQNIRTNSFYVCVGNHSLFSVSNKNGAQRIFNYIKEDILSIISQRWGILSKRLML